MNITITGNLGSGKTSVCKELKKAGFQIISAGDIFREIAAEKGMSVIELNEAAKKDRSIDDMLDNRSAQLGKTMDHTVFDSRLAWHFVENSFKVFLLVDTQEAARRVFAGDSRGAEEYRDADEARAGLESRAVLEKERFSKLYGLDYYDASNYDLIIESSCAAPEQIAQEICRNFEIYQAHPFSTKTELNIKSLHLEKSVRDMDQKKLEACVLEEQKDSQMMCAADAVELEEREGHYYLLRGHHRVFAAADAGKVFAEVKSIRRQKDAGKAGEPLPGKSGYMIDFSRLYGGR